MRDRDGGRQHADETKTGFGVEGRGIRPNTDSEDRARELASQPDLLGRDSGSCIRDSADHLLVGATHEIWRFLVDLVLHGALPRGERPTDFRLGNLRVDESSRRESGTLRFAREHLVGRADGCARRDLLLALRTIENEWVTQAAPIPTSRKRGEKWGTPAR